MPRRGKQMTKTSPGNLTEVQMRRLICHLTYVFCQVNFYHFPLFDALRRHRASAAFCPGSARFCPGSGVNFDPGHDGVQREKVRFYWLFCAFFPILSHVPEKVGVTFYIFRTLRAYFRHSYALASAFLCKFLLYYLYRIMGVCGTKIQNYAKKAIKRPFFACPTSRIYPGQN